MPFPLLSRTQNVLLIYFAPLGDSSRMAPRKTMTKKAVISKPGKQSKRARLAKQTNALIERKPPVPLKCRNAVFTGKVFVISGEFKDSHENMEKWIVRHGGRVDKVVT